MRGKSAIVSSAGWHLGGGPSRTPERGASWDPDGIGAECPDFTVASLPSPSTVHSYALTSQGGCCPRVRTDAGWECRAQLGPTAAVYLIKTWEDPSVARPKGDTESIYRVVEHTHSPAHTHSPRSTVPLLCLKRSLSSSQKNTVCVCVPQCKWCASVCHIALSHLPDLFPGV